MHDHLFSWLKRIGNSTRRTRCESRIRFDSLKPRLLCQLVRTCGGGDNPKSFRDFGEGHDRDRSILHVMLGGLVVVSMRTRPARGNQASSPKTNLTLLTARSALSSFATNTWSSASGALTRLRNIRGLSALRLARRMPKAVHKAVTFRPNESALNGLKLTFLAAVTWKSSSRSLAPREQMHV